MQFEEVILIFFNIILSDLIQIDYTHNISHFNNAIFTISTIDYQNQI